MSGRRWTRLAVTTSAVAVLAALALEGGNGVSQARPVISDGPGNAAPPAFQTMVACERSGNRVCNPEAEATSEAGNPLSQPPSPHPKYLTLDEVTARVRGTATTTPEIHARFMSYPDFERLSGEYSSTVHPARMVWVVTVHADEWTQATLQRGPQLVHYYTVVIDAETGMVSDSCIGCNLITS